MRNSATSTSASSCPPMNCCEGCSWLDEKVPHEDIGRMTTIEEQVLALPRDSKHRLFELLRAEFDPVSEADPMPEWLFEELEKRRRSYECGESKAVPVDEAFARIRAK